MLQCVKYFLWQNMSTPAGVYWQVVQVRPVGNVYGWLLTRSSTHIVNRSTYMLLLKLSTCCEYVDIYAGRGTSTTCRLFPYISKLYTNPLWCPVGSGLIYYCYNCQHIVNMSTYLQNVDTFDLSTHSAICRSCCVKRSDDSICRRTSTRSKSW